MPSIRRTPTPVATRNTTRLTVGILQISTTQNRIELIEGTIERIGSELVGASGGYRDQLLSNLVQEREALHYWTTQQGEQLAIVIRTSPDGAELRR